MSTRVVVLLAGALAFVGRSLLVPVAAVVGRWAVARHGAVLLGVLVLSWACCWWMSCLSLSWPPLVAGRILRVLGGQVLL